MNIKYLIYIISWKKNFIHKPDTPQKAKPDPKGDRVT